MILVSSKKQKFAIRPRKVSIEEAKELCKNAGTLIYWRPNYRVPEDEQYAIVLNEEVQVA